MTGRGDFLLSRGAVLAARHARPESCQHSEQRAGIDSRPFFELSQDECIDVHGVGGVGQAKLRT